MFEDNTKSKQAVQRIGQIKIHENEAKLAPEAFYAHVHEESFNINYVHKRKTILGHIMFFKKSTRKYSIPTNDHELQYVGHDKRKLRKRGKEHEASCKGPF